MRTPIFCRYCGNEINKPKWGKQRPIYCDNSCQQKHKQQEIVSSWLRGETSAHKQGKTLYGMGLRRAIREYLLEQAGYACQICGFSQRHPTTGNPILEVDHLDGDTQNGAPANLQVVCPNCHAMSPHHRGLNRGRGRGTANGIRVTYTHHKSLDIGNGM